MNTTKDAMGYVQKVKVQLWRDEEGINFYNLSCSASVRAVSIGYTNFRFKFWVVHTWDMYWEIYLRLEVHVVNLR
jgi:hypothetical protein